MEKQYPATAFNLSNFLADVVSHSQALRDKIVAANFISADNVVQMHLQGTITTQDDIDLKAILDAHNTQPDSPFKIMSLINPEFKGISLENIDFKRHLRSDIALDKRIVMHPNGRPEKSTYKNGNDVICEIRFTFQDNNYLLTEKCEHLYQQREDGTWSDPIIIGKRTYDHTDLVDGSIVVEERADARKHIVSSMKAFLSGVIMQALSQTMDEVIVTISPLWSETEVDRLRFIEFGTSEWKNHMAAIDLSTTPHSYLAIPIDQSGTTVRDYMVGRLTY